ncbi:hypothetical protein BC938DRAFT_483965, partial [Jimgerdemannia flammicorona]
SESEFTRSSGGERPLPPTFRTASNFPALIGHGSLRLGSIPCPWCHRKFSIPAFPAFPAFPAGPRTGLSNPGLWADQCLHITFYHFPEP